MLDCRKTERRLPRDFLTSLARDVRGNTLALMAAMLIPMSALAGSAVDIARVYVVKVRLQQACDAGVLAGRKFMSGDDGASLDDNATAQANNFFTNNFTSGWMGTTDIHFTPVKASDSEVSGTASATLPMTIMRMFGFANKTISATCTARYDVADTDVMFVLDTTGSMACLPNGSDSCGMSTYNYTRPSDSGGVPGYAGSTGVATHEITSGGKNASRIAALRQAVIDFYNTFATNADPSTKVRYGFVTYSSSVNVGQAILDKSSSYLVGSGGSTDMPYYQTRHVIADYVSSTSDSPNGKSATNCTAPSVRTPASPLTYNSSTGTATNVYDVWTTTTTTSGGGWWGGGQTTTTSQCVTRTDILGPRWEYKRLQLNVSPLIGGSTTMLDPTKVQGQYLRWYGCVETPVDNPGQSSFSTSSLPSELNPDLKPTGSQRWWPHLQDAEYPRSNATSETANGESGHSSMGSGSNLTSGYVACGKPAKRLGEMSLADVTNYVNAPDFVPEGGTYHDIGMIWGARLIAPDGAWGDDTRAWDGHNPPNRVIIFMTDGVMSPDFNSYSMYGLESLDKRVANGDTSQSDLTSYHNKRFLAACAAAKARNIDVWTVAIASSASSTLQQCATTTAQAIHTTSGTGLSDAFKSIAQHLAMLRITH